MLSFKSRTSLLRRFGEDEGGNIALTFAVSAVAIMGCMGAAMDFSTLSNAEARSQAIADQTALTAAIFVRDNNHKPEGDDNGYLEGNHTAEDLGYEFKGWVDGGASNVNVSLVYDDSAKEARVKVTGRTVPTFMQIFGKKSLDFEAESIASYLQIDDKHPASIALVLDNSGSMNWDDKIANSNGSSPAGANPRIDALEDSVNKFSADLSSRLGTEDSSGQKTIRMGMLPYSSNIISDNRVDMKWGYLTPNEVNAMTPSGSTNSNPPMAEALQWMNVENTYHQNEADRANEDYREPLKFIVFMSDGQNTLGSYEFLADDTAPVLWRQNYNGSWSGAWASSYPNGRNGYTRGHLRRNTDRLTIDSCNTLKAQGAQIFTIGYALDVGDYHANYRNQPYATEHVNLWNQTNAYNLLLSCASKAENFTTAGDTQQLEEAFDEIQNAIVKELIRIKS
ncbi:hypothetical protein GCM10011309_01490 [Litorimonas cladophorae]|uniref:VWFA domain-containing protein n=1 Tax=Litorimonas cladophorae TaxID=1220491 RepID=A0A918K9Y3_9PROT|nr:pilus assembly protein [Litorimonas cladophorae]GGX56425.1 hypothetical protein GCM10011309_01490 [Litorimonas cladophorae]